MSDPEFLRKVRALQSMPDRDYASAVYQWIRNADSTPAQSALFRDPDLISRTYEAVETLIATTTSGIDKMRRSTDPDAGSKLAFRRHLLRLLEVERRTIRSQARREEEQRAQLRRGKGPRHRAMIRLSREPDLQVRFLAMVREEQAKDDARARID